MPTPHNSTAGAPRTNDNVLFIRAPDSGISTDNDEAVPRNVGPIHATDARDAHVEAILTAEAGRMVDAVHPVLYRRRDDAAPMAPQTLHAGFLAQDIKAAMNRNDLDFAVWGLDDPDDPMSRQHLRTDQLIPVLWAALKQTRATLAKLARNTH